MPSKYTYDKLSFIFGVSREAIARIVKSKWTREANIGLAVATIASDELQLTPACHASCTVFAAQLTR